MNSHYVLLAVGLSMFINGSGYLQTVEASPDLVPGAATPAAAPERTAKVLETMNSGGYTYVHVETGTEKRWVAAPEFEVEVGDTVVVPEGMAMTNFRSNTLGRTFEVLYLVPSVAVKGRNRPASGMRGPHGGGEPSNNPAPVDLSGIAKVTGGKTVGELFEESAALAGTSVRVRGKVVKFTADVMGKNWIHLQDGTGAPGANDLVVNSDDVASIGDTIVVNGILRTDRDLGFGYKYAILIEDAKIKIE